MIHKSRVGWLAALAIGFSLSLIPGAHAQYAGPVAGQKVAFLGDSITANGWGTPGGYVKLVEKTMADQGKKIEVIPAGVSGNTSKDMLARLDRDVLSKKPDWMTLSCGVNDVWHGVNGCTLDEYEKNINAILDQTTAAGIKVVILTSTLIREDPSNPDNQKLSLYNDFLRSAAKERKLPLADLNADEQAELAKTRADSPNLKGLLLTVDGVHMNGFGNQMMAGGVLKAFGLTDDQLAQAKASWMDLPDAMMVSPKEGVSVQQYLQLRSLAQSQGKSVDDLLNDALQKDVQNLLSMPVPPPAATAAPSTNAPAANP